LKNKASGKVFGLKRSLVMHTESSKTRQVTSQDSQNTIKRVEEPNMSGKKILIVDDDPDVLRGLGIRLKASGYDIVFAADGYAATTMAQQQKPDLILLDIGLPAGDGFVVMERLRNIYSLAAFTPIIVLTARDPRGTKDKALQAGATAFFQKPADNEELLAAIEKALRASGG
jgi:DNA-binding response OmpR family regulator